MGWLMPVPFTKAAPSYFQDGSGNFHFAAYSFQQGVNHLDGRQALAFAARELKRLQVWFGKTAEQEILKYDGNYLAEQLENSVWYDLQMIRVNGSLVGAILGAVIYLVMYAVKGGAIL